MTLFFFFDDRPEVETDGRLWVISVENGCTFIVRFPTKDFSTGKIAPLSVSGVERLPRLWEISAYLEALRTQAFASRTKNSVFLR